MLFLKWSGYLQKNIFANYSSGGGNKNFNEFISMNIVIGGSNVLSETQLYSR